MERSDEVLAERMVDADLASYGGVDLCEQGGRHLYQGDPTQDGRRGEARHVAYDAAADSDDGRGAVGRGEEELLVDPGHRAHRLGPLAVRYEDDARMR